MEIICLDVLVEYQERKEKQKMQLILGSPPGKVYSNLRYISKRNAEKF